MSNIINIVFATANGRKCSGQLSDGYTVNDIKQLVKDKFGSDNFRLVVYGKEIQDNDPVKFAELKRSIKNNTLIYVCQRMNVGLGMVDIQSHKATILADLEDELRKMSTQSINSECMICAEEKKCLKFCCGSVICKECCPNYFVHCDYKPRCLTCDQILAPETCFKTPQFIRSLVQLNERLSHDE
ncbi:unnamed protein product [Adineta steineri]|uniref:Ubiquitin-like domain-containing protein n=1 Tax=Adineta steineri TaxID=433720 RepID=A0A813Z526_9BILA|nr:unnamed protein product [Adineta steineri]CAF1006633.1 unnamed protein product [Adineta steineri]CAF4178858.1 unnamed protein product [Adineta steineri]CAF4208407.1 unnamed protein product [Adineta steineri]